jgi:hypothetical protein
MRLVIEPFGPVDARDLQRLDPQYRKHFTIGQLVRHRRGTHHSVIVGRKGSGKTTSLNQRIEKKRANEIICQIELGKDYNQLRDFISKLNVVKCGSSC